MQEVLTQLTSRLASQLNDLTIQVVKDEWTPPSGMLSPRGCQWWPTPHHLRTAESPPLPSSPPAPHSSAAAVQAIARTSPASTANSIAAAIALLFLLASYHVYTSFLLYFQTLAMGFLREIAEL